MDESSPIIVDVFEDFLELLVEKVVGTDLLDRVGGGLRLKAGLNLGRRDGAEYFGVFQVNAADHNLIGQDPSEGMGLVDHNKEEGSVEQVK